MQTAPTSSILLIHSPRPDRYSFGADSLARIEDLPPDHSYSVMVYFDREQEPDQLREDLRRLRERAAKANTLLISARRAGAAIARLRNEDLIQALLPSDDEPALSLQIQSLLAEYAESEQHETLLNLYHEQNRKLERLNLELEDRVEKRQKYLLKAQKNLKSHEEKISLLHEGLLSIFRGESIGHIEGFLFDVLKKPLRLEWLRIRFSEQSLISSHFKETELSRPGYLEIPLRAARPPAVHLLLKKKTGVFSEDESELLSQLSETLSLAVGKIIKRQEAESLKQQWESTFDAISAPLCLTDAHLQILRINRSFSEEAGLPIGRILGKHALAALIGAEGEQLTDKLLKSKTGKLEAVKSAGPDEKYFEISLHTISPRSSDNESAYMLLFKDITEQRKMEIQLLETSKMAELGIIGSSIAHELNNPIAGMTSFLQLIKMDLRPEHECWEDVVEMETAARRCKEIVENLLGFARKQDSEGGQVDLAEVVAQAAQISELQTRAKGLTIETPAKVNGIFIKGNFNQLVQAVQNVLRNALEACLEKREKEPAFRPRIECKFRQDEDEISLLIADNGPGIPKEIQSKIFNPLFTTKASGLASGLGLTVAFKIITEHRGKLEIASRWGRGTTARISFRRPDL
jgi:signal transduction histidine kinase